MAKKKTTPKFVKEAQEVHGDLYDYSLAIYDGCEKHVTVICRIHGPFKQLAKRHLSGKGCPECRNKEFLNSISLNTQTFIKKAREIHGDKYDYSKVDYKGSQKKVTIICQIHGSFDQFPGNHTNCEYGCPKCGVKKSAKSRSDGKEIFIKKAKEVHGDLYDYSKVNYKNAHVRVTIICKKHGEFVQQPMTHLRNHGCALCGREAAAQKHLSDTETFIKKARKIHGDKYNYSLVEYKGNRTPVKLKCQKHGLFKQKPIHHLSGRECQKCSATGPSKGEIELANFISSIVGEESIIRSDRSAISPYELDVYIPDFNIAFEYNGDYWHTEERGKGSDYHAMKSKMCSDLGIHLIHVKESEWIANKEMVKSTVIDLFSLFDSEDRHSCIENGR